MARGKVCFFLLTVASLLLGELVFPRGISPSGTAESGFNWIPAPLPGYISPNQEKEILNFSVEHLGCDKENENFRARVRVCDRKNCEKFFFATGEELVVMANLNGQIFETRFVLIASGELAFSVREIIRLRLKAA